MTQNPSARATVTVLGTGVMGAPMARNLAAAGHDVRVWNRSRYRAEPLAAHGVTVCGSVVEATRGTDVLITMLFDADSVIGAVAEALPELGTGALWLQTSTVGVDGCRRLAALADEHRVTFVDAPVLGTRKPAEDAALLVLASGPESARPRTEQVLGAVAKEVRWVGPAGTGSALKLTVNSWILALTQATAEAVALAEGLGLDPQAFLDTIAGGATDTPYAHLKAKAMMSGEFDVSFALDGALKDAGLILDAARAAGVDMTLTAAARRQMAAASAAGHGDSDMAATYLASRREQ